MDDAATVHPYLVDALTLVGKGSWPLGDAFAVFAKLGLFAWRADILVQCVGCASGISAPDEESGVDWTAGLGIVYELSEKTALRAEYERFNTDRHDINFLSLSVQVDF